MTIASAGRAYVYVLFGIDGAPFYVGKGTGNRWAQHDRLDGINPNKDAYIEQCYIVLGEVPKVKVRENLSDQEAFATEIALIKAIGRFPDGPLANIGEGGEGI